MKLKTSILMLLMILWGNLAQDQQNPGYQQNIPNQQNLTATNQISSQTNSVPYDSSKTNTDKFDVKNTNLVQNNVIQNSPEYAQNSAQNQQGQNLNQSQGFNQEVMNQNQQNQNLPPQQEFVYSPYDYENFQNKAYQIDSYDQNAQYDIPQQQYTDPYETYQYNNQQYNPIEQQQQIPPYMNQQEYFEPQNEMLQQDTMNQKPQYVVKETVYSSDNELGGLKQFEKIMENFENAVDQINPFSLLEQIFDEEIKENDNENQKRTFYNVKNANKSIEQIQLNETKKLIFNELIIKLDQQVFSNPFLLLTLEGTGMLNVDIYDNITGKIFKQIGQISKRSKKQDIIVVFETHFFRQYPNNYLKFSLNTLVLGENLNLTLKSEPYLQLEFGQHLKLNTNFANNVRIKVSLNKKTSISQKSRFQFILRTNLLQKDLNGDEYLAMSINYNKDFSQNNSYDMQASGNSGDGLIKTLNTDHPYFCTDYSCFYSVDIQVLNISDLIFLPSVYDNESIISFNESFEILEELEINEILKYKLQINNPQKNGISFFIEPRMSVAKMYMQPDDPKDDFTQSQYITSGQGLQELLITKQQINHFKYTGQVFYVVFENPHKDQVTTFTFKVKVMKDKEALVVKEDFFVSGVLIKNEIVNYFLDLYSSEPESFSLTLKLSTYSQGKAKIAIKECLLQDEICEVNEQDLRKHWKDRILMISKELDEQNDHLSFQFNCPGNDPFETKNKFLNIWQKSKTCKFTIGVFGIVNNDDYIPYALEIVGDNVIKTLEVGISHNVTLMPYENRTFNFSINQIDDDVFGVDFNVVSLSGSCVMYFSVTNSQPSEKDHSDKLIIDNQHPTTIQLTSYQKKIPLRLDQNRKNIYVTIVAESYTALDIYSELFEDIKDQNYQSEKEMLTPNKLVFRSIKENNYYNDSTKSYDIYYKNFLFQIPFNYIPLDNFNISVNSHHLGLYICVQINQKQFDFNKECDFHSSTENVEIKNQNNLFKQNVMFAISVQKRIDRKVDLFRHFPIDFDILIHSKTDSNRVEILTPSLVHTKKIDSLNKISFQINMVSWQNDALIVLTTHLLDIQAEIKTAFINGKTITTLSHSKFGMYIDDVKSFKKKYCTNAQCSIFVEITNKGTKPGRFSLTYTNDQKPFQLKEGEELFLPAQLRVYVLGRAQSNKSLEFSFSNNMFQSEAYGVLYEMSQIYLNEKNLSSLLSENKYSYKTPIGKKGELLIKGSNMQVFKQPLALFMIQPKFNIAKQRDVLDFQIVTEEDKVKVSLNMDLIRLNPYTERRDEVVAGQFKYYHFVLDNQRNVSIFVTNSSGQTEIYLNKGFNNLPTETNYLLKGKNYDNQIINLTPQIISEQGPMKDSYTVGVYGIKDSRFSILLMDDEEKLVRVNYQQMLNMRLQKLEFYFFDYYNDHHRFNLQIFSEESDLQIDIFKYDPDLGENFLDIIKNENNISKKELFKKGNPPFQLNDKSFFEEGIHFIIRLRPLDQNTFIHLAIFDPEQPIEIPKNTLTPFIQEANSTLNLKSILDKDYRQADVFIRLFYGELEFAISDTEDDFGNMDKLVRQGSKNISFQDKETASSNDILIFSDIYIKIKSLQKSKFVIQVIPKNEFIELQAFEKLIVRATPTSDQFVYFYVEDPSVVSYKKIKIDIEVMRNFDAKLEFLYNNPDTKPTSQHQPLEPMPIKLQSHLMNYIFNQIEILPEIKEGFFIIKIPKSYKNDPIKISYSLNDKRQLDLNDSYRYLQPLKNETLDFAAYLPEKGEFRVVLETCNYVEISEFLFEDDSLDLKANLFQTYNYFYKNDQNAPKFIVETLKVPVVRYINKEEGLVTFKVKSKNFSYRTEKFNMLTSFRSDKENMILKDYVDYYPMVDENFTFKYVKENNQTMLVVKATLPQFKEQLKIDYPDMHFIKIVFNVYLIPDRNFHNKFQLCGYSAIDEKEVVFKSALSEIQLDNMNSKEVVNIIFQEEYLQKIDSTQFLTLFGHLKIQFVYKNDIQTQLTVEQKYIDIPFFMIGLENEYVSVFNVLMTKIFNSPGIFTLLLYLLLIIIVSSFVYNRFKKRRQGYQNVIDDARRQYGKDEEHSGLEMTQQFLIYKFFY